MNPNTKTPKRTLKGHTAVASLLAICSLILSCRVTNKITVKDDVVYNSKRIELKFIHKDYNNQSPLQYILQSIVKEIKSNNEISCKVYDVLNLNSTSFKLDDKVFYIIDDKVFPMPIEYKEIENSKIISENREDIQTSDSTKISVVTGYSENNSKITRFSYNLPTEAIAKIKDANRLVIRYYSGPDMINVKVKNRKLKKLKEMIDTK